MPIDKVYAFQLQMTPHVEESRVPSTFDGHPIALTECSAMTRSALRADDHTGRLWDTQGCAEHNAMTDWQDNSGWSGRIGREC